MTLSDDTLLTLASMLLFLLALSVGRKKGGKHVRIHLCIFVVYNVVFFYLLHSSCSDYGAGLVYWVLQLVVTTLHALLLWIGIACDLLRAYRKNSHGDRER